MLSGMVAEPDDGTGVIGAECRHQAGDPGTVSQSLESGVKTRLWEVAQGWRLAFRPTGGTDLYLHFG